VKGLYALVDGGLRLLERQLLYVACQQRVEGQGFEDDLSENQTRYKQ
jgi:hypothetical protein